VVCLAGSRQACMMPRPFVPSHQMRLATFVSLDLDLAYTSIHSFSTYPKPILSLPSTATFCLSGLWRCAGNPTIHPTFVLRIDTSAPDQSAHYFETQGSPTS